MDKRAELARRQHGAADGQLWPWLAFVEADHHFESEDPVRDELRFGIQLPLFYWKRGNRRAADLAVGVERWDDLGN